MLDRPFPRNLFIRMLTAFSAAPIAVLVILTAIGALKFAYALVAAVVAVAGIAVFVRGYALDLSAAVGYLEKFDADREVPDEALRQSRAVPVLFNTINRMRDTWTSRTQELSKRASTIEKVFENLPYPVVLLDEDRHFVRATAGTQPLVGGNLSERDLTAVMRNPNIMQAAARVLRDGGSEEIEFTLEFPVDRTFGAHVLRLVDSDPEDVAVIIAMYDLTAMKRSEQMRVDFIANASHELRTPLSVLIGSVKTLRGPAKDDPAAQEKFLDMMDSQADRMVRLVNDLLSLSRIEINEHTPPSKRVDLARLVWGVADTLEMTASARGIKIEIVSTFDKAEIVGDDDELVQLFQNLINNAIKYGRKNSVVRIDISRVAPGPGIGYDGENGMVSVAVSDQGEGIAAEHIPRLTERFYRVDTARSRELGGTGLGLAIVKHVVNRHRGKLLIESTVGQGSVFNVLLPLFAAKGSAHAPERAGKAG